MGVEDASLGKDSVAKFCYPSTQFWRKIVFFYISQVGGNESCKMWEYASVAPVCIVCKVQPAIIRDPISDQDKRRKVKWIPDKKAIGRFLTPKKGVRMLASPLLCWLLAFPQFSSNALLLYYWDCKSVFLVRVGKPSGPHLLILCPVILPFGLHVWSEKPAERRLVPVEALKGRTWFSAGRVRLCSKGTAKPDL